MSEPGWAERKAAVAAYYEKLVARYGHDPRACDYGRAESQLAKFAVLAEVMPLEGRSVLDVGCGFADYADFVAARHTGVAYEGVDLTAAMVEEGRRAHPSLPLHVADVLSPGFTGQWDVVTANGIFYLLGEEAEAWMERLVGRMFELCRHAVAFNSLSRWAPRQEAGEFYADPARTLEMCRRLTPRVTLRHDYLPHDFTVYLYRGQPRR